VSEGAISFLIDHAVSSRVARLTYGLKIWIKYNPKDPQHYVRRKALRINPSGSKKIPYGFSSIIAKVCLQSLTLLDLSDHASRG